MVQALTPIRNVVFDLGGVISYWKPADALCGRFTAETIDRFFKDVDFFNLNDDLDAGLDWNEAYARVEAIADRLGHLEYGDMIRWYHEHFEDTQAGKVPGAAQMVRDLKAAGVGVYALTNWNGDAFRHAVPAAPVLKLFDGFVVSGQEHIRKPDPRIYRIALERFGLDAATTLFTDDKAENAAAAREVGMQGVQFAGMPALRQLLREHGVDIPALR